MVKFDLRDMCIGSFPHYKYLIEIYYTDIILFCLFFNRLILFLQLSYWSI